MQKYFIGYWTAKRVDCTASRNGILETTSSQRYDINSLSPSSQHMTRNRFQELMTNIHVNHNSTIPSDHKDKIFELRPFVKNLNNQSSMLNNGRRKLSVNE